MEIISKQTVDDPVKKPHKLVLENREKLTLTGVGKVHNANDHIISLEVDGTNLTIEGTEMQVSKLDVASGNMEILGIIDQIKYNSSSNKTAKNLLNRIFK